MTPRDPETDRPEPPEEAPEPLVRALGELFERRAPSARLRDELRHAARRELVPTLRPVGAPAWTLRLRATVGAAAAALVLVTANGLRGPAPALDLDGDGRVDVVDARLLARQVEAGRALPPRFDRNGDGRVDRADAERLARDLVELGR